MLSAFAKKIFFSISNGTVLVTYLFVPQPNGIFDFSSLQTMYSSK
jgi:hypothetical protein